MAPVFIRDATATGIDEVLRRRHELGLDVLDEVWEGVLHVSPPPHKVHQQVATWLGEVFRTQARRHGLGRVYVQAGLREPGSGTSNYRVPDVMVAPAERELARDGWVEGGVVLVVELRLPRDEVLEKLPFHAARGVDEVLWLNPHSFEFDVFRLAGSQYVTVAPERDGACELKSIAISIRRTKTEREPMLDLRDSRGGGPLPVL